MWYVYDARNRNGKNGTIILRVRTERPTEGYYDGFEEKSDAVAYALQLTDSLATEHNPVQLNIQGKP